MAQDLASGWGAANQWRSIYLAKVGWFAPDSQFKFVCAWNWFQTCDTLEITGLIACLSSSSLHPLSSLFILPVELSHCAESQDLASHKSELISNRQTSFNITFWTRYTWCWVQHIIAACWMEWISDGKILPLSFHRRWRTELTRESNEQSIQDNWSEWAPSKQGQNWSQFWQTYNTKSHKKSTRKSE